MMEQFLNVYPFYSVSVQLFGCKHNFGSFWSLSILYFHCHGRYPCLLFPGPFTYWEVLSDCFEQIHPLTPSHVAIGQDLVELTESNLTESLAQVSSSEEK